MKAQPKSWVHKLDCRHCDHDGLVWETSMGGDTSEPCPWCAGWALLKENAELKRRIRLARRLLTPVPPSTGTTAYLLLDLRRPLPKRGKK